MVVLDQERYEILAEKFQREQVSLLRSALKQHGIAGDTAREICGVFSFDLAMVFDQGELELDQKSFRPVVAFTADEEEFLVQPARVSFHEHAYGTVADEFDRRE